MRRNTEEENVLSSSIDADLVEESRAVDLELRAGDVSAHHPNIVHGSNSNRSKRRRCGLTIRYIPTTTRIVTDQQWASAFLLRGEALAGVNDYFPWPRWQEGRHMPFRGCTGGPIGRPDLYPRSVPGSLSLTGEPHPPRGLDSGRVHGRRRRSAPRWWRPPRFRFAGADGPSGTPALRVAESLL